jgi:hypothetical protein
MFRLASSIRTVALGLVAVSLLAGGCSGKGKATKANFEKVKNDMTVKEVEDLMGTGKEPSDDLKVKISLKSGVEMPEGKDSKTICKIWESGDDQYFVIFKEDKVIKKDTITKEGGKKDKDEGTTGGDTSRVTLANFEKIKKGDTKEDVEKILGKTTNKNRMPLGGKQTEVWTYGDQDTSITITFTEDGKVTAMSAPGLKK